MFRMLAFSLLISSVGFAAEVGDSYRLLLDCQKSDGEIREDLAIAFDIYVPGRGASNSHHTFVVEKFGAKHGRTKLAKLANSRQITRGDAELIEVGPVLSGELKLVFEAGAIKAGKPFQMALQKMQSHEVVTTYDCNIEK